MPVSDVPGYDPNAKYESEFFLRQFLTNQELDEKARKQLPPRDEPQPFRSMGDRARAIVNAEIPAGLRPAAIPDAFGNPIPIERRVSPAPGIAVGFINTGGPPVRTPGPAGTPPAPSLPTLPERVPFADPVPPGTLAQGFAQTLLRDDDATLANLANLFDSGAYSPEGEALLGFVRAIGAARAGGRIVLIWDPAQRRYVYVSATYALLLQAGQGIAVGFEQLGGASPGFELPGVAPIPPVFVDVPGENPVLLPGRGIIGGIINPGGGVQPTLPNDPPKKILPPLPDVNDKGNIVQPGGFLDLLFRRNPADP